MRQGSHWSEPMREQVSDLPLVGSSPTATPNIKLEVSKMDQLVNLLWIGVFTGGFCFLLVFGEVVMNAMYELIPPYRKWVDKQMENLPDWDEEVE